MSLVTNPKLYEFHRWLRSQPMPHDPNRTHYTSAALAEEIMVGRAHLSLVLTGKRSGIHTWPRIVKVLPMEGLLLLEQCSSWNKYAKAALLKRTREEAFARCVSDTKKTKERITA